MCHHPVYMGHGSRFDRGTNENESDHLWTRIYLYENIQGDEKYEKYIDFLYFKNIQPY